MRKKMANRKTHTQANNSSGATVGYEAELWRMADALRGSMDAAEYKHVILGLISLKYISDRHTRSGCLRHHKCGKYGVSPVNTINFDWVPE